MACFVCGVYCMRPVDEDVKPNPDNACQDDEFVWDPQDAIKAFKIEIVGQQRAHQVDVVPNANGKLNRDSHARRGLAWA